MAELAKARSRVGKFLPVSGKKPVFSAVKTGLAKIVFAGKNILPVKIVLARIFHIVS